MSGSWKDGALSRRTVTLTAIVLATALLTALAPIVLIAALAFDIALGKWRLPTIRVAIFALGYLLWEVAAALIAATIWVTLLGGRLVSRRRWVLIHRRVQEGWVRSLLLLLQTLMNLRIEVDGIEHAAPAPALFFTRHASIIDTLLPIHVAMQHDFGTRYVMKDELELDPAIDVMGYRLDNLFIDRSPERGTEMIAATGELARGLEPWEVFVIFPEGSRFSEAKRERAIARLQEHQPEAAAAAARLRHTLPPRPGGALAAIAAAPADADVVFVSHTGLEGLSGPVDLWKTVPFTHPVRVHLRRVARADIPTDATEAAAWLVREWQQVDNWIAENQIQR